MHQITMKSMLYIGRTKKNIIPLVWMPFFLSHFSSSIYFQSILKMNNKCNKRSERDEQKIKCLQFNGKSICINMRMGHIRTTNVYNICYENNFVGSDDSCILDTCTLYTVFKYMTNKWICYPYLLLLYWAYTQCIAVDYYRFSHFLACSYCSFSFLVTFTRFSIRTPVTGFFLPSLDVSWENDKYKIRSTILAGSIVYGMKKNFTYFEFCFLLLFHLKCFGGHNIFSADNIVWVIDVFMICLFTDTVSGMSAYFKSTTFWNSLLWIILKSFQSKILMYRSSWYAIRSWNPEY